MRLSRWLWLPMVVPMTACMAVADESAVQVYGVSIRAESATFRVHVAGTADHRRRGGWTEDPTGRNNPTRRLVIRNQSERVVLNPRVFHRDRGDWFNMDCILRQFVRPGMSDEEKAFALWQWCRHNIHAGATYGEPIWGDTRSMTRFFNAFGTGACGTYHVVMPIVGYYAGLRTFGGCLAKCSHAVQQEFYDGQERYLDAHISHDEGQPRGWFALQLDNRNVASAAQILEDRYLIDRAGAGPGRFSYVSYFGPESSFHEWKDLEPDRHEMRLVLRPGEAIVWDWDLHAAPWRLGADPDDLATLCSGRIEYTPRLEPQHVRADCTVIRDLQAVTEDGTPVLVVAPGATEGAVDYALSAPYPITGAVVEGALRLGPNDFATLAFSLDGEQYAQVWSSAATGEIQFQERIPDSPSLHEPHFVHRVWFRAGLRRGAGNGPMLRTLTLKAEFQASRPSLPSLYAGDNQLHYHGTFGAWRIGDGAVPVAAALVNGGFEFPSEPARVPYGWTAFGRTDGAVGGRWLGRIEPWDGLTFFGVAADWDAKQGGLYQQVRWCGGPRVKAVVRVNTSGDTTESAGCRIGLDPEGGTNPDAPSVVWSAYTRASDWQPIEVVAALPPRPCTVTVYVAHRHAEDGRRFNVSAFDGCALIDLEPTAAHETSADLVLVEYTYTNVPDLPVPRPPARPVDPPDGAVFDTGGRLQWDPATTDEAGEIDNYEVFISTRPDLAWPVLPNFHCYTRSGSPSFALAAPDALQPDATYYWRVRGRSAEGVWGDWSATWSFVARAPGPPQNLVAEYDGETSAATLTWQPPATGSPAVAYEVYGSGEHGFSPLRTAEQVSAHGRSLVRPATLLRTTDLPRCDITACPAVFFRVVSVDAHGNRSVPTQIVQLPAPVLLPVELPHAIAGQIYSATLPVRMRTGRWVLSLRQGMIVEGADTPQVRLRRPADADWLSIDSARGVLSATPTLTHRGKHTVELELHAEAVSWRTYVLHVDAP